ncbi:carbohydrate ABC transporter permease [Acutalibacter muris]|uniref:carbohydrate ABC transporter permease n=1 Tax=Acutalibacter muris TaxID=1796620 RepID=UPI001C3EA1EE|nr:sugar ABC transporter permease [Acutalibacter muris]
MRNKISYWLFLLPSLLGVAFFYIVPFIYSFCYAVIDNMTSWKFVGLRHFEETLRNPLFIQAAGNTVLFVCICVPLSMGLALLLALCLKGLKRCRPLATLVLLVPLVVPSGSIVSFWNTLFSSNGLVMKALLQAGFSHDALSSSDWSMAALVVIFLWKNVSYNIVLFWSGLNWIPKTYYEQMALEGAGVFRQFANVTWVYLAPTTFVVLLMSIVNSFKVFKEVYMLYGSYPSPEIYMLQHYMNNQFAAMNMQKLSATAYIMFLVIGLALLTVFYAQKRVTDSFQ